MEWQDDEVVLLVDLYGKFIQDVGQDKMFKTIEDLWIAVGLEITHSYSVLRSPLDCKNKFNSLKILTITSESEILTKNSHLFTNESNFDPISTKKVVKVEKWIQLQILEEDDTAVQAEEIHVLRFPKDIIMEEEYDLYIQDDDIDLRSDDFYIFDNQENDIENEKVYDFSIQKDVEDFISKYDPRLVQAISVLIEECIDE
uniref:Myb-like domain-containing protein n=1 Tax=Schizaphis graminum TaxID=13262 RepID=A0A2S2NV40_SCHGA